MGRNVSGQLHNKEVKIVVMSAQTSFPQFLEKNAVSPPGANEHSAPLSLWVSWKSLLTLQKAHNVVPNERTLWFLPKSPLQYLCADS